MIGTIRSSYTIDGVRLFCDAIDSAQRTVFEVRSRWQWFHRSASIHEALAVFEGLCFEDGPTRRHAKNLVIEARRNRINRFTSRAAWERRVIECARRRSDGLVPVIGGSHGAIEIWKPRQAGCRHSGGTKND